AIAIGIAIGDVAHADGVTGDLELVALGVTEVEDDIVADALDPVIMHGVVLTGHTRPVDRAIGIDVLGNDVLATVERQLEPEAVGPCAALQDVVGGSEGLAPEDLDATLRGRCLARIGTAEKRVVADSGL